jgi:hypothetical protein
VVIGWRSLGIRSSGLEAEAMELESNLRLPGILKNVNRIRYFPLPRTDILDPDSHDCSLSGIFAIHFLADIGCYCLIWGWIIILPTCFSDILWTNRHSLLVAMNALSISLSSGLEDEAYLCNLLLCTTLDLATPG